MHYYSNVREIDMNAVIDMNVPGFLITTQRLECDDSPCPADRTKRSLLNQKGFLGLYCITSSYRMCPMGAHPMGRPGCPELAFSTASMARNRMVFTDFSTRALSVFSRVSTGAVEADTFTTFFRCDLEFPAGCALLTPFPAILRPANLVTPHPCTDAPSLSLCDAARTPEGATAAATAATLHRRAAMATPQAGRQAGRQLIPVQPNLARAQ